MELKNVVHKLVFTPVGRAAMISAIAACLIIFGFGILLSPLALAVGIGLLLIAVMIYVLSLWREG